MRVLFVGEIDDGISVSSHHAQLLAQAGVDVAFDDPDRPLKQMSREVDVLHVVTGLQSDNRLLRRIIAARAAGIGVIRFWTGLDWQWARVHVSTRRFAQTLDQLRTLQIAPSAHMARELGAIGVAARAGVTVSANISAVERPQPMPPQFTVLCRLPADRREFFGGPVVDALIRRFRATRFLILGDDPRRYRKCENVEALDHVDDVSRTIQRASVLVMPVRWGCRSRLMLEALSHGRHVVSTIPCAHTHTATTVEEFAAALRELLPDPPFNLAGREYACRLHDRAMIVPTLRRALAWCMDETACGPRARGPWLAAMAAVRNPAAYGRRTFPPPHAESIPPHLDFLRLLLPCANGVPRREAAEANRA